MCRLETCGMVLRSPLPTDGMASSLRAEVFTPDAANGNAHTNSRGLDKSGRNDDFRCLKLKFLVTEEGVS